MKKAKDLKFNIVIVVIVLSLTFFTQKLIKYFENKKNQSNSTNYDNDSEKKK